MIPALIRKAVAARDAGDAAMSVWGSGTPLREFMHADDLADALVFVLEHYSDADHINIGTGEEVTIAELAQAVADIVGFTGALAFDATRPDGTPAQADGFIAAAHTWLALEDRPCREGLADALCAFQRRIPRPRT